MTKRIKRSYTKEHTWKCSACGTPLMGRVMICPSCGKPKGDEKYDETRGVEVRDAEGLAESRRGVNWSCAYCHYDNRGDTHACERCGAEREGPRQGRKVGGRVVGTRERTPTWPIPPRSPKPPVPPDGRTESEAQAIREMRAAAAKVSDLSDETRRGLEAGVMSNDSMEELLRASGGLGPNEAIVDGRVVEVTRKFEGGGLRDAPKVTYETKEPARKVSPPPPSARQEAEAVRPRRPLPLPHPMVVVVATVAILLVGLGVWLFTPWHETVSVTQTAWQRYATLMQRVTRHGSGWGHPIGSFNVACVTRQHGTENCHPHDCNPHSESYDCNCHTEEYGCHESCTSGGNGFSHCHEECYTRQACSSCSRTVYDTCYDQCPVYDQWCNYDYYDWVEVRTEQTHGTDANPVWPAMTTEPNAPAPQRVDHRETLIVEFSQEGEHWSYTPSNVQDYQRFRPGETWDIEVNHARMVTPQRELH